MLQLDDQFLVSVGLGDMPQDQRDMFLEHLLEELETRVGTRLSQDLSDEKLAEFEKLVEVRDEKAALAWLEDHRPDYKTVVADELEKIRAEVAASRDRILGDV